MTPWKIDWNESLFLGIPEIDRDHERFAVLLNDLNSAIVGRADKAQVHYRLDLLYLDAQAHFEHEERLFARYRYPEHNAHAALHRKIEAAILREFATFDASNFDSEWLEAGLRIKELLVSHLLQEDMKYREFMKSKMGIAATS